MDHILSPRVLGPIQELFSEENIDQVNHILLNQCWKQLPGCEHWGPEQIERIHMAVLKLSAGDLDELDHAVALAKQDWRDLLVAAGFANDPEAHRTWQPKPTNLDYHLLGVSLFFRD